jgi:hypothetical protein
MTIVEFNNYNGLQRQMKEHYAVTGGIFYCRDSAEFSVSASNKHSRILTDSASKSETKT